MTACRRNARLSTRTRFIGDDSIRPHSFALLLADLLEDQRDWFTEGISEYALISKLQAAPLSLFDRDALRDPLVMFQTHFLLFHALYQVRDRWQQSGTGDLHIHTLKIVLNAPLPEATLPETPDPLRAYYLNWDNFTETGKEDVDALLDDFWKRIGAGRSGDMSAADVDDARQELGLGGESALTLADVKRQYRKLVHVHHPDKGGDEARAKRLVRAYTVLSAHLRQAS